MGIQIKQVKLTDAEKIEFDAEWNAAVTRLKRSGADLSGILIVIETKEGNKNGTAV